MSRKSLSKKTRFEIFKRDNFTCQYCGKQPPDVILVVDHIEPVAEGGDNDTLNLITSCEECNQGKGARRLDNVPMRPDADLKYLETMQEIEELRRYQKTKKLRDDLEKEIVNNFFDVWYEMVDDVPPEPKDFYGWLAFASPDQIGDAIRIVSTKRFLGVGHDKISYCSGILRNMTDTRKQ